MPAFAAAAGHGYPIELDVQLSSDGKVIVFHDHTLLRATGQDGHVRCKSAAELQSLSLFDSDERIPLLEDVFSLVGDKVPILIEVKNEDGVGNLERAVASLIAGYPGEVAVQSFNPKTVAWFRTNTPHIACGQISGDFHLRPDINGLTKFVLSNALLTPFHGPQFLAYEMSALNYARRILFRHVYGLPLLLWTIRNEDQARVARALGGNLIFEGFLPRL